MFPQMALDNRLTGIEPKRADQMQLANFMAEFDALRGHISHFVLLILRRFHFWLGQRYDGKGHNTHYSHLITFNTIAASNPLRNFQPSQFLALN